MKKNIALSATFAVLGAALAANALAQAKPAAPAAEQSWLSGAYIGVSLGRATGKDFCNNPALGGGAATCDDKDQAWRLLAGYQFNKHFGLEAGYHDFGKVRSTGPAADIKLRAAELVGIGILPVGGITSVYGKLGGFYGQATGGGAASGVDQSKARITFGGGVQFDLPANFAIRGEWQRYPRMAGGGFGGTVDVNVWSAAALYKF